MARFLLQAALAMAVAGGSLNASAQQVPVYNYFARTLESDKVLLSNEGHHLHPGKALFAKAKAMMAANPRGLKPNELEYARKEFDFVLGIWPNHLPALSLQADVLTLEGQPDLIDNYFVRAYQMSPNVVPLHVLHGITLMRRNKLPEAIQRLQMAVDLNGDSKNAHYYLGMALLAAKRMEEANVHAQRAYALGHEMPRRAARP